MKIKGKPMKLLPVAVAVIAAMLAWAVVAEAQTDVVPPVITNVQPADGGTIYSSSTVFSADYSDPAPSSGIDPGTAMIHLDNRMLYTGCTADETHTSCPKSGLALGPHKLEVFICDNAGNCAQTLTYFTVASDTVSPVVDSISADQTSVSATYHDPQPGSGIDSTSAKISVDTYLGLQNCTATTTGISCPNTIGLVPGKHSIEVFVKDYSGNEGKGTGSYEEACVPDLPCPGLS
ncbi:MAG: hypothetical protein ACYCW5_04145 [Thermoleophilia bacterium]